MKWTVSWSGTYDVEGITENSSHSGEKTKEFGDERV
jgi:hypothetical protein